MGIDYNSIAKRMERKKFIREQFLTMPHPWEIGFDWNENDGYDFTYIKWDVGDSDKPSLHRWPRDWSNISPIVLYTQLVRCELDLSGTMYYGSALHGTLCPKCNAIRAMRRKAPK